MTLFFFNDTATTEIYTLSLHDALPILGLQMHYRGVTHTLNESCPSQSWEAPTSKVSKSPLVPAICPGQLWSLDIRSEEHTSELQSRQYLVCRLLLEKKKKNQIRTIIM